MSDVWRALDSFFGHLSAISWQPLALAVAFHLVRLVVRSRSWRNVIAAAYPDVRVRWRHVLGAYVSGVGVNALLPARSGDVLRLFVLKRRVEGSTYPTLAATLVVETIFDLLVAFCLLAWALSLGVLPDLDVLPRFPSVDWFWILGQPRLAAAVGVLVLAVAVIGGAWVSRRIADFRRRVAQGFAILRTPGRYVRRVVLWQALDWALRVAALLFFLEAFGLPATVRNALLAQTTQSLSTLIPVTPGGIGTEQALLVYVLSGEAAASALLSFSVGMKVIVIVVNVAVGFAAIALLLRTLRWRRYVDREDVSRRPESRPA